MNTKKRRVIWMDDENWDRLGEVVNREQARTDAAGSGQKITRSLVLLDALDRGHFRALRESEPHNPANYSGVEWNIGTGEITRYDTQPVRAVPKVKPRGRSPR